MNKLKNIVVLLLMSTGFIFAQEVDTLHFDLSQAEKLLLENNLSLLAEQLNLDKAEAEKIQAKVWPNPILSIEEFNPYITSYQKKHADKQASLFTENFGKYRQVEVQLEQVFNLAGGRKKQKAIADVSAEQAEVYLADFLLNLKTEFRKTIYDFAYHQEYIQLLKQQIVSVKNILKAYENQYEKGNVNKMELTRLRVSEMNLRDEIIDEQNTLSELQAELIIALNLPDETNLSFDEVFKADYNYQDFQTGLAFLQEKALENRHDIKISDLQKEIVEKEYAYEKSLRTPELGVSVNYDRGGGIYPDYFGVGVSMDLPFTNPNKGNIQKAKINIEQQEYLHQEHLIKVKTDIRKKYERVKYFSEFFEDIDAEYIEDLDKTMNAYTTYFKNRNINITTYMDFLEAYIESKESVFDNQREFLNAVEDLKYATGLESLEF